MTGLVGKTASAPATNFRPSLFYRSAREGMVDFLESALSAPAQGVLLPAFVGWSPREGSGIFDPILEVGARAGFYDLNSDLTVNLKDLKRRLTASDYKVLVVVHYFGRTEPQIATIRELADLHGVLLVEDLAHGFYSSLGKGEAGRHGDVSLFSLHKMFPLENGGLVSYARSELVTTQQETMPHLASAIMSYDWRTIGDARRHNFSMLTKLLLSLPERGTAFRLMWEDLGEHDVPQSLPVRIVGNGRDGIYEGMNADGFGMVSLYHTLIEPVRVDFEGLNELSRHIINFPVHQDVRADAIAAMVDSFRLHLRVCGPETSEPLSTDRSRV